MSSFAKKVKYAAKVSDAIASLVAAYRSAVLSKGESTTMVVYLTVHM